LFQRFKLEYDGAFSNFDFKFNLRHYIKVIALGSAMTAAMKVVIASAAGAHTRPLFSST